MARGGGEDDILKDILGEGDDLDKQSEPSSARGGRYDERYSGRLRADEQQHVERQRQHPHGPTYRRQYRSDDDIFYRQSEYRSFSLRRHDEEHRHHHPIQDVPYDYEYERGYHQHEYLHDPAGFDDYAYRQYDDCDYHKHHHREYQEPREVSRTYKRDRVEPARRMPRVTPIAEEEGELKLPFPSQVSEKTPSSHEIDSTKDSSSSNKKYTPIIFDIGVAERHRFFVARCNYYDMFAKSKKDSIWRTPMFIAKRVQKALEQDETSRIFLFFTVHGSQYWHGVAEIDRRSPIEMPILGATSERLARAPLIWICIADVPFFGCPSVPGIKSEDGEGVKESFEIPSELAKDFLPLFEKHHLENRTFGLGIDRLKSLLKP